MKINILPGNLSSKLGVRKVNTTQILYESVYVQDNCQRIKGRAHANILSKN